MSDEATTRLRLFVPCRQKPAAVPLEHEWIANPGDGSFARAFSFGTVDDDGVAGIDAAAGALVLYCPFDLGAGRSQTLTLISDLNGALAVRVEQSKLGWARDQWLAMIGSDDPFVRHRAVVTLLGGHEHLQSCGMHAFSLPDARIEAGADDAGNFVTTFNVYQMAEDPLLLSGQTFSLDAAMPKRVLQRWPDDGYPQSSPCHNPFGVWRLGPPGGKGRGVPELAAVSMPSFAALLSAMETQKGKPLTRAEVEAAVMAAPCIALEHKAARDLERARGYADLDPELAWEQWQDIRAAMAD